MSKFEQVLNWPWPRVYHLKSVFNADWGLSYLLGLWMQPRLTSVSCFVHLWRLQMTNEPLKLKSGVKQSVSGIQCVFQKCLLMAEQRSEIAERCSIDHLKIHRNSHLLTYPPTVTYTLTQRRPACWNTHTTPAGAAFFSSVQSSHDSMGGKRHLGTARRHGHGNAVLDFLPSQWKTWNKSI